MYNSIITVYTLTVLMAIVLDTNDNAKMFKASEIVIICKLYWQQSNQKASHWGNSVSVTWTAKTRSI